MNTATIAGLRAAATTAGAVAGAWAATWSRLAAAHGDLEGRLASLPRAGVVARLEASAGRQAGRAVRGGEAELEEFKARLARWEAAVANALAELDHARSLALCSDCGAAGVPTVAPGLTGGRVCQRCLRTANSERPRANMNEAGGSNG